MDAERRTIGKGRYEMSGLLGRGGMAEVRRAEDLRLGRTVAIKWLHADLARDPTFQARFSREAQSAASLNHPTIVAVYDTGAEVSRDGSDVPQPYIVMEYVEGRTLRDILREGRRILPERALEITASVLGALDYSHRAGIIHRDIKPANVMLTPSGDVKVMDFGIARAIADTSSSMTQTAAVVGTAQYLSPEQARGEQVDARSDLYSAGCLLFELLTGRPPFVGDSPVSVAYQHVREEPVSPSALDPEVPPAIDAITLKALAKSVDERYQSATEMRDDIDRALEGRAVTAPAVGASAEAEHFFAPPGDDDADSTTVSRAVTEDDDDAPRRRTRLLALLLLLLAALVLAALIVVPQLLGDEDTPQARVPDLQGMTVAQARAELDDVGLELGEATPVASDTAKAGLVVNQEPNPLQLVDEGASVAVEVSVGADPVTVPDVSDKTLADATTKLEELELEVLPVPDLESTERRNQVTGTDPRPGTEVAVGDEVEVMYSTGFVEVATVVGETQAVATQILKDQGFSVVPSQVESDRPKGDVVDQEPVGGPGSRSAAPSSSMSLSGHHQLPRRPPHLRPRRSPPPRPHPRPRRSPPPRPHPRPRRSPPPRPHPPTSEPTTPTTPTPRRSPPPRPHPPTSEPTTPTTPTSSEPTTPTTPTSSEPTTPTTPTTPRDPRHSRRHRRHRPRRLPEGGPLQSAGRANDSCERAPKAGRSSRVCCCNDHPTL
ncbi:MAG: Stk1 family PASTA domain-containing Ser/Thr kinase [Nocardioidaceae bacterium]